MAVKTNPRFVEALMLGANHEMERELLWQGFPTDSRGTPFQRFWQRFDEEDDIAPIHKWAKVPLGQQPGNTRSWCCCSAVNCSSASRRCRSTRTRSPRRRRCARADRCLRSRTTRRKWIPTPIITPFMRGHLYADITYVGFDIVPEKIADYFFVIEEHMTEPRFGFDEPEGPPVAEQELARRGLERSRRRSRRPLRRREARRGVARCHRCESGPVARAQRGDGRRRHPPASVPRLLARRRAQDADKVAANAPNPSQS